MMFKGKLTKSAGALILMGALAACGGGGDSITPAAALSPLGQLVITSATSGLAGTYQAEAVNDTQSGMGSATRVMVVIQQLAGSTQFEVNLEYNPVNGAVLSLAINANNSIAYECGPGNPCPTDKVSIDTVNRIVTMNNLILTASNSTTLTSSGRLQWIAY